MKTLTNLWQLFQKLITRTIANERQLYTFNCNSVKSWSLSATFHKITIKYVWLLRYLNSIHADNTGFSSKFQI